MPTRHIVKVYAPNQYYHVFNRGWNLTKIFRDERDYHYFEDLLERHISPFPQTDDSGKPYRHLFPEVHLNAYCLMENHFHILFYQYNERGVQMIMQSILTAYTMYFNRKYGRRGPLFESTFKAVIILKDAQLQHITRYIHLNRRNYRDWKHSSYSDYIDKPRDWVDVRPILDLFTNKFAYEEFIADYESLQRERDEIKRELYGKSA